MNTDQWYHNISDTLSIVVRNQHGICFPTWPLSNLSIFNKFQIWLYIKYVLWALPFCDMLVWFAGSSTTSTHAPIVSPGFCVNPLHLSTQLCWTPSSPLLGVKRQQHCTKRDVSATVICVEQPWQSVLHAD
jgi:hypothetical protein